MPGSVHVSGEHYEWEMDDERATVSCATLKAAIVKIAIGDVAGPALARARQPARHGAGARRISRQSGLDRGRGRILRHHHLQGSRRGHQPRNAGKTARDSVEHHEGRAVYGMPTDD